MQIKRPYRGTYSDQYTRHEWIYRNFGEILKGVVVDVGCGTGHLRELLDKEFYLGIDVSGRPDILADLEFGLPLSDKSANVVVCTEVLEHINGLHYLFDELTRVSSQYLLISLPNAREIFFRIAFATGLCISPYYKHWFELPLTVPNDRHKWIFDLDSARRFVHSGSMRNEFKVMREFAYYDEYPKSFLKRLFLYLPSRFGLAPNVFALSYWCLLKRETRENYANGF
jgi:SAM-dependent methyltransferase